MKMNGDLGFMRIHSDQLQLANPFLILIFIPLYEVAVYPLLKRIGICRPLQKMALGGILAGASFLCSMFVQIEIDKSEKSSVSVLWQLPQYIVITLGEVKLKFECSQRLFNRIYFSR